MIIYKVTNLINGKIYIGQTIHTLKQRKNGHETQALKSKRPFKFHENLIKYGFNNFKWEIIDECNNRNELDKLETYYINYYNSYNNGYNMTPIGKGSISHSKLTREKLRQIFKTPYNEFKLYIESFGYKLLTNEKQFQNLRHYINVECPNKHIYKVRGYAFQRGDRCKCEHTKRVRTSFSELKNKIEKLGYEVLVIEKWYYDIRNKKFRMWNLICKNGHEIQMDIMNILNGHQCKKCVNENKPKPKQQQIIDNLKQIIELKNKGYSLQKIKNELNLIGSIKTLDFVLKTKVD